jgi:hypothetical protein
VSNCDPDYTLLAANKYYSPNANASLRCGGKVLSMPEVQKTYGNEIGSTFAALPKASEVLHMVEGWLTM